MGKITSCKKYGHHFKSGKISGYLKRTPIEKIRVLSKAESSGVKRNHVTDRTTQTTKRFSLPTT